MSNLKKPDWNHRRRKNLFDGDLISRKALLEELENDAPINWTDSDSEIQEEADWERFKRMVSEANTVQPVVRRGKWIMNSDRPDMLICTVCSAGFDVWKHESKNFKFCPNCGADMRGKDDET